MTNKQLYHTISVDKYIQVENMRLSSHNPLFYGRGVVNLASNNKKEGEGESRGGEWLW